ASNFDGEGITIAQIGSGCDFGVPDIQHSYHPDSLDASGSGLALTWYTGNSTIVDPDIWLVDPNHLLTYSKEGNTFVNLTGWDPLLNAEYYGRYLYEGYIGLYSMAWGISINATMLNELRQDWKLPSPTEILGDYHIGYSFQQHTDPYAKIFSPSLVYSGLDGESHLLINWEDTMGWNKLWTGGFYYQSYSLVDEDDVSEILAEFDWDFTDEFDDSEIFDLEHPIVAHDYSGDGLNDFSLGALSWVFDKYSWFDDEPMFCGFRSDNQAFALLFDRSNFGTSQASIIAASGNFSYFDVNNQSTFSIQGIAPKTKILSMRTHTFQDILIAHYWAAGYELVGETFVYTGSPRSLVIDDSWSSQVASVEDIPLLLTIKKMFSSPYSIVAGFPGILQISSVEDYYLDGSPASDLHGCPSILTVGTLELNEYLEPLYGLDQPMESIIEPKIHGPNFYGYTKPELVAPGVGVIGCTSLFYQYMVQSWSGGVYSFPMMTNYSTSHNRRISSSVVAGCAALTLDALVEEGIAIDSQKVKMILECTAVDIGYDVSMQGFGRVDAERACAFVTSGEGFQVESLTNIPPYTAGSVASVLYFGDVYKGDSIVLPSRIYDDVHGTMVTDLSGWTIDYSTVEKGDEYQFQGMTYLYNDSVTNHTDLPGYFVLSTLIDSSEYDNAIATYGSVSLYLSFEASPGDIPREVLLFDWNDSDPLDGIPNHWNSSIDLGKELIHLASGSRSSNSYIMHYASSSSSLSTILSGNLTLAISGPSGVPFRCSIVFWERIASSELDFVEDSDDYTLNHTLVVPSDANAGVHLGFFIIDDGTVSTSIPWTYTVVQELIAADGDINELCSSSDQVLTPYSGPLGSVNASNIYPIETTNPSATLLGFRAFWDTSAISIELRLYSDNGNLIDLSTSEDATGIGFILELLQLGRYYLEVRLSQCSSNYLPQRFSLHVMWYSESLSSIINFSYTSSQTLYPAPLESDAIINEDQVVIHATAMDYLNLPNLPEAAIDGIEIHVSTGIYFQETKDLVIPTASYDTFGGPIDLSQYSWLMVEGIEEGDLVHMVCDFTNGDCDFMAWWADTDNTTWSYGNNILEDGMATGARPEVFSFIAERSGAIAVGCFDYDKMPGSWTLTVDARLIIGDSSENTEVEIPLSLFGKNSTFTISATAFTSTNLEYTRSIRINVNIYFSPVLGEIIVTGTGAVKTIVWTCSDRNVNDQHVYDFHISSDGGDTFMLVAARLLTTSYVWDSTGYSIRDYIFRITAFDNDPLANPNGIESGYLWPGLYDQIESDPIPAGTVHIGGPTSSTTTTSNPTRTDTLLPDDDLFDIPLLLSFIITGTSVGIIVIFSIAIRQSRSKESMSPT
ncbi:MAG: S8 family serine peptidase, partial [Candidatus Thorarchaeota archaeon]